MTTKFLITRDGREYIMDSIPEWAESEEYKVEKLSTDANDSEIVGIDDTTERLEILEELYELEEQQIAQMKQRLEEFVELVEAIVDIAVPTENLTENKAKLLLINESCKKLLQPSE